MMHLTGKSIATFVATILFGYTYAQFSIVSVSPGRNETGVNRNANITITFSASTNANTVNSENFLVYGEHSGPLTGVLSGGGTTTVTFNPSSDFKSGERITVTLTDDLGGAGTTLIAPHVYQFTAKANSSAHSLSYFREIGQITDNTAGVDVTSFEVVDIDGDNDLDILTSYLNGYRTTGWYENLGNKTFTYHIIKSDFSTDLKAGDVDADGDMDFFAVRNNSAYWFENDGAQTFTENLISTSASSYFEAGDLNGDGHLELIQGNFIVLMNNGSEDFTQQTIKTGDFTYDQIVQDFDGDGDLDILGAKDSDYYLLLNDGAANFTEASGLSGIASYNAYDVKMGDLDGDGDADLVSYGGYDHAVTWAENLGTDTYTEHTISNDFGLDTYTLIHIDEGDIDGDNDIDILIGGTHTGRIYLFENNGNGQFILNNIYMNNQQPTEVRIADLDGDGDMDIVSGGTNLVWYENTVPESSEILFIVQSDTIQNGDTFDFGKVILGEERSVTATLANTGENRLIIQNLVTSADFSINGETPDTLFQHTEHRFILTADGQSSGTKTGSLIFESNDQSLPNFQVNFTAEVVETIQVTSTTPASGAVNQSEDVSILIQFDQTITANSITDNNIIVQGSNTGIVPCSYNVSGNLVTVNPTGNFMSGERVTVTLTAAIQSGSLYLEKPYSFHFDIEAENSGYSPAFFRRNEVFTDDTESYSISMNVHDFDQDGFTDISLVNENYLILLKGDDSFQYQEADSMTIDGYEHSIMGDFDRDGDTDLFSYEHFNSNFTMLENDGSGHFINSSVNFPGYQIDEAYVSDINLDGWPDIVATTGANKDLGIFINRTDFEFELISIPPTRSIYGRSDISVVDLNGDGALDILTAESYGYTDLVWYENDGYLNFEKHILVSSRVESVHGIDFDQDGDTDIITGGGYSSSMFFFENDGTGNFSFSDSYDPDADFLNIGDFDGDSDFDIVTQLYGAYELVFLENDGSGNLAQTTISPVLRARSLITVDFDQDSDLDIISLVSIPSLKIVLFENVVPEPPSFQLARMNETLTDGETIESVIPEGLPQNFSFDVYNSGEITLEIDTVFQSANVEFKTELPVVVPGRTSKKVLIEVSPQLAGNLLDTVIFRNNVEGDSLFTIHFDLEVQETIKVMNTSPVKNDPSAPASPEKITITLDQSPLAETVSTESLKVTGSISGPVRGEVAVENDTVLAFYPLENFIPGEIVTVDLSNTIQSVAGNRLIRGFSFQFIVSTRPMPVTIDEYESHQFNSFLQSPELADLTGTGRVAVISPGNTGFNIQPYDQPATFHTNLVQGLSYNPPLTIDMDGDDDLDLIVGSEEGFRLFWIENIHGAFELRGEISEGPVPIAYLRSADLDGDGRQDIVSISRANQELQQLVWFKNTTEGFIMSQIAPINRGGHSVHVIDLDSDGDIDVLFSAILDNGTGENMKVIWAENLGDGAFDALKVIQDGLNPNNGSSIPGDLDSDGDVDIIVNTAFDGLFWLENDGNQQFAEHPINDSYSAEAMVDREGDGDVDILISFGPSWLINDGDETFSLLSLGNTQMVSRPGDFDSDGDIDVIATPFSGYGVWYEAKRPATVEVKIDHLSLSSGATYNFGVTSEGNNLVKKLTIKNAGDEPLQLQDYALTGNFILGQGLPEVLEYHQSVDLDLIFEASSNGDYTGTFTLQSSDAQQPAFEVDLIAKVDFVPELELQYAELDVVGGDTVTLNGIYGMPLSATFTISNTGSADLTLSDPDLSEWVSLQNALPASLPEGEETETIFTFYTDTIGSFIEKIVIANNDPDENPITFYVSWSMASAGFTITDSSGIRLLSDSHLDFGSTNMDVPVTIPLTITNIGTGTLTTNGFTLPQGYSSDLSPVFSLAPGESSQFLLTLDADSPGTREGTVIIYALGPVPFQEFLVTGNILSPQFQLEGDNELLSNGQQIDFGVTSPTEPISVLFVFSNSGDGDLILSDFQLPNGFTLTGTFPDQVASFSNETFEVALNTSEEGSYEGELSFKTNDPTHPLFTLTLTGEVTAVTSPGIKVATMRGTILSGEPFEMGVTSPDNALVETFTITNIGNATLEIGEILLAPETNFTLLGDVSVIEPRSSENFTLIFSSATEGSYATNLSFTTNVSGKENFEIPVSARVSSTSEAEIVVQANGKDIADGGTLTFRKTFQGEPQVTTFSIFNYGNDDLQVSNLNLPAGFSLIGDFPQAGPFHEGDPSIISPLGSASFSVSFDALTSGTTEGTGSFTTNDDDENPFEVILIGSVFLPPTIQVELDGEEIVNGDLHDFGEVEQGESVKVEVTIINEGDIALELSAMELSEDFLLVGQFPTTLSGGEAQTFSVSFSKEAPGLYESPLTFTTNDPTSLSYTIRVAATCIEPLGLDEEGMTGNVYPNPSSGIFRLELPGPVKATHLEIVNLAGKVVKSEKLMISREKEITIDLTGLPAGIYQLIIQNPEGTSLVYRLIKQ